MEMESFEASIRVASTAEDLMADVMDNWCECHLCADGYPDCGSCRIGRYNPAEHASTSLLGLAIKAYEAAVELEGVGSPDGAEAWARAWRRMWLQDQDQ